MADDGFQADDGFEEEAPPAKAKAPAPDPLAGMTSGQKFLAGIGLGMSKVGRNLHDIALAEQGKPSLIEAIPGGGVVRNLGHLLGAKPYSRGDWQEWSRVNRPLLESKFGKPTIEPVRPAKPPPGVSQADFEAYWARRMGGGGDITPAQIGTFVGEGAATAPVAMVAGAPARLLGAPLRSLAGRVLTGAATGASEGATVGALTVEDPEERARAALGGLTMGAGVGAGIPLAGAALRPGARAAAGYFDRKAIEQGRKALSGIGTALSARKEIPEAVVRQALDTGVIKPFGTVKGAAARAAAQAEELGAEYSGILERLEAAGVHGPRAEELAREFSARASRAAQTSLNSPRPGMLQSTADELEGKALPITGRGRLGLMQTEEMKRGLQAEAQREYDKIARQYTTTGQTKKEIAGVVKDAIEQAVQEQSGLAPAEAAAFEPVKQRLSNTLGALKVAEEGAARAARRKPVSLTDTIVGSAAGAAAHNPVIGAATALAHGLVDRRVASTSARASRGLAKMLIPTTDALTGQNASQAAALLAALKQRLANGEIGLGLSPAYGSEEDGK